MAYGCDSCVQTACSRPIPKASRRMLCQSRCGDREARASWAGGWIGRTAKTRTAAAETVRRSSLLSRAPARGRMASQMSGNDAGEASSAGNAQKHSVATPMRTRWGGYSAPAMRTATATMKVVAMRADTRSGRHWRLTIKAVAMRVGGRGWAGGRLLKGERTWIMMRRLRRSGRPQRCAIRMRRQSVQDGGFDTNEMLSMHDEQAGKWSGPRRTAVDAAIEPDARGDNRLMRPTLHRVNGWAARCRCSC